MQSRTVRDKESEENCTKQKMMFIYLFFFPQDNKKPTKIISHPQTLPCYVVSPFLKEVLWTSAIKLQ